MTSAGPWWLSGKEPAANAGDTASVPGPGRSQMLRDNSALLKPSALDPVLHDRIHCNEKPAQHHEEKPLFATTRESVPAAMKTQCSHK